MQAFVMLAQMAEILFGLVGLLVGLGAAFLVRAAMDKSKQETLQKELDTARAAAQAEADKIKAQAESHAKTELIRMREQFDSETASTRQELRDEERRLAKREDNLDSKLDTLHIKEKTLDASEKALHEREKALAEKDRQLSDMVEERKRELMRVSQLNQDQARKIVLEQTEQDMEHECAEMVRKRLEQAREKAEDESREIVVGAIQRYAADHTCESTVATVDIPSDDMKGRVIGREGRNIRAFEKATGVDVIVDDTPGVVVVSGFDPVRRQIARRALEKLIQDGRIHPTRIEEVVAQMEKEVNKTIQEKGKQAVLDAKLRNVHPKLTELLGRLHFRTSYGQNVLQHAIEVSNLSKLIAEDLNLNGQLARRAGLLHDVGKAVDHEVEGGHPEIGADLLKRYGEKDEIVNASAAHHGDIEATTILTPIVAAADAISASRPGARRETLERYIQRLQKLEDIATGFDGVRQSYAIQAGREVRVIVDAEDVDDRLSAKIARDIARRIEDEMDYPGEIQVTLVREVRCVEYAR